MTDTFEHRLLIGSRDWEHVPWQETFYPHDLPADWRLTYYANEFRVVLVPWARLAGGQAAQWAGDIDAGFGFICESPPGLATPAEAQAFADSLAPLGERCAGIRLLASAESLNRPGELDVLLGVLAARWPTSVDLAQPVSPEIDRLLRAHDCGMCWHGPPQAADLERGRLALAVLPSPQGDLRLLRSVVETCLAASSAGRTAALVFDGEPPDVQTMEQAGTIADLL